MFNKTITAAGTALSALVLTATSAAAQTYDYYYWWWGGWSYGGGGGTSSSVPEIDASTGALALAAVAAGLLLAREMRRRKSR
ncbi:VPEID-CTERM sorting domain-containing protein [Ruegeria pomeroyi]|nr:VPEID-CTERM sorting domain-containing protein [Ruegeria pomeroyi]NVK97203.1 VPEID-CTERM sorting domain-containing protein [Ruegeria pomeroyi]NVL02228.1 VPEID-CTERM sorting domain-containing protein [Ruegeria pomeroyi]QWV09177.1 VPEID-CTERM sorting domain-containing protein [Ruegeria pomeroyi]